MSRLFLYIKSARVWFNCVEERDTPETKREKHVIWVIHLLKCATVEVKKIVQQILIYFIKRYVTFLQGFFFFFFLGEFVYDCYN